MFAASISSIPYLDVGLDQKLALPKDSFLLDWFNDMNKYLHTGPPVYFVVKEGFNFENSVQQNKVGFHSLRYFQLTDQLPVLIASPNSTEHTPQY